MLRRRKSNGFTTIEILAVFIILIILAFLAYGIYRETTSTCVEYEETPVTDCYNWGYHTTCESYIEKRCAKYDD